MEAIAGGMPPGYGVGDAAALHFVGTELSEVVSSRPEARARYVYANGSGGVCERELAVRYLGDAAAAHPAGAVGQAARPTGAAAALVVGGEALAA
jgi:hypothetical protein